MFSLKNCVAQSNKGNNEYSNLNQVRVCNIHWQGPPFFRLRVSPSEKSEGKPPGSVFSHIDIILQGSLSGNHYFYILKGVQQIDRTWFLKESGRRYFENTAYFNIDESRARAVNPRNCSRIKSNSASVSPWITCGWTMTY